MRVLLARIVGLLRGFLAGKRFDRDLDDEVRFHVADGAMEIVGIARDLKEGGLKGVSRFVMHVPVAQTHAQALEIAHGYFQTNWVVRADRGPDQS